MSNIHGFTHTQALDRVPNSVKATVSPDIQQLQQLGVKAGGVTKEYNQDLVRSNLRLVLKDSFSLPDRVTKGIVDNISKSLRGPVLDSVAKRLGTCSDKQKQFLTKVLQGQGEHLSSSERMLTRSTLLLAFANGSSGPELVRLKTFLNRTDIDASTRENVFKSLNTPHPNVTSVLDEFEKGPFRANPQDAQTLTQWAKRDGGSAGPEATKRVDAYMKKLETSTGITSSHPDYDTIKAGAAAVSAYTSEVYKPVNNQMRADRGGGLGASGAAPELADINLLSSAARDFLAGLPDFQGIVSRGGGSGWQDDAIKKYVPGQIVTEYTFVSASANKGFAGSIQFLIESHHGKEVSDLSVSPKDGREVMFPPGTRFEVLAVHRATEDTSMDNAGQWVQNEDFKQTLVIIMREVG